MVKRTPLVRLHYLVKLTIFVSQVTRSYPSTISSSYLRAPTFRTKTEEEAINLKATVDMNVTEHTRRLSRTQQESIKNPTLQRLT